MNSLIARFQLEPHPEGGFYRQSYRSTEKVAKEALPNRFAGDRFFSTAIYFLLPGGTKSRLHRIHSDEVWHFYLGGPLKISQISADGMLLETILGQDVFSGQALQHVVPAGCWFGAQPLTEQDSFVGCTVSPGFDFADFEMGNREDLLRKFPGAKSTILALT